VPSPCRYGIISVIYKKMPIVFETCKQKSTKPTTEHVVVIKEPRVVTTKSTLTKNQLEYINKRNKSGKGLKNI
jgi:hypothetical protein